MRLVELEAKFVNDTHEGLVLELNCPRCRQHTLRIPVIVSPVPGGAGGRWTITSIELDALTLTPVVPDHEDCPSSFTVSNGEIVLGS